MLTRSELVVTEVVTEVASQAGGRSSVRTQRTRGNRLSVTCTCEGYRRDGWCRDQIELLCLRYDSVLDRDPDAELHFEDLVIGTALADLADEVDLAMSEYEAARNALARAPQDDLTAPALRRIADLASDLKEAAHRLDDALARFKRNSATARD